MVGTPEEEKRRIALLWKKTPTVNPRTGRSIKPHAKAYNELKSLALSLNISPPASDKSSSPLPSVQPVVVGCTNTKYSLDASQFEQAGPKKRLQFIKELKEMTPADKRYMRDLYARLDICDAPLGFQSKGMNEEFYIPYLIRYQHVEFGKDHVHDDNIGMSMKKKEFHAESFVRDDAEFEEVMRGIVDSRPDFFVLHVMMPMRGTLWHQNMLMILKGKHVIRFEPYTADVEDAWSKRYDAIVTAFADKYNMTYDGVFFSNPKRHMFQSIESTFGKCPWDVGGFCVPWSLLMAEILLRRTIKSNQRPFSNKASMENYILYFTRHPLWSQPWFLRKLLLDFLYSRTKSMFEKTNSPTYRRFVSPHFLTT